MTLSIFDSKFAADLIIIKSVSRSFKELIQLVLNAIIYWPTKQTSLLFDKSTSAAHIDCYQNIDIFLISIFSYQLKSFNFFLY